MTAALMDDFPPAPDRLVTLANWRKPPFSAWGFRNVRRLIPTANIAASESATALETSSSEIAHIGFTGHDGHPTTVGQALRATQTDAFVVLRRGRIRGGVVRRRHERDHAAYRVLREQVDLRSVGWNSWPARPARSG